MLIARIPAQHTAHTLLGTLAWLLEDPAERKVLPRVWTAEPLDLDGFRAWLRRCLDSKISAQDPRSIEGRKTDPDYVARLRRDHTAILDYRRSRIVRRGSGLETAEARRAAPDVHEAMLS